MSTQSLMLDALPTSGPRRRMIHSLQAYEALGLSKTLDEEVFLLPRWIEGPVLDVNVPLLSRRSRIVEANELVHVGAFPTHRMMLTACMGWTETA